MSLLIALIIGVAAGAAGGFFFNDGEDFFLISTLMGIVGSILGLAIFYLLGLGTSISGSLFSLPASLCSAIGALLAVMLFNFIHHLTPKRTPGPSDSSDEEPNLDD